METQRKGVSDEIIERARKYIAGGVVSLNRKVLPNIVFTRAVVNFNDVESVEYVMKRYPIACVLTEPVLQNVGVIKPREGYLEDLIRLCERYGAVCIFDEVKTGFSYGPGRIPGALPRKTAPVGFW